MARKDTLAAGARTARFAGGVGDIGVDRNLSKEPRNKAVKIDTKVEKKRTFTPLGTTILVRRAVVTKDSTIIVPDAVAQEQPAEGTVLSVGAETDNLVRKGDDIVFGKYAGAEFPFNGETLLIMDVSDVKGIVS